MCKCGAFTVLRFLASRAGLWKRLSSFAMGCSVSKNEDILVTMEGPAHPCTDRRVSAAEAESTGEAEKASSATTLSSQLPDAITIVHFNDVYNIEERAKEPCGGAPRFKKQVDGLREHEPLVFFSGDALNPSNSE